VLRLRRRLLTAKINRRPSAPVVPLGCSEPVEVADDWVKAEARRLLDDDEIGGDFLVGEELPGVPPAVLAEMDRLAAELERSDV